MIRVMDDWTKHLDQGRSVDVIHLDFMKAFDKVSHEHLLYKLCHPVVVIRESGLTTNELELELELKNRAYTGRSLVRLLTR